MHMKHDENNKHEGEKMHPFIHQRQRVIRYSLRKNKIGRVSNERETKKTLTLRNGEKNEREMKKPKLFKMINGSREYQ